MIAKTARNEDEVDELEEGMSDEENGEETKDGLEGELNSDESQTEDEGDQITEVAVLKRREVEMPVSCYQGLIVL